MPLVGHGNVDETYNLGVNVDWVSQGKVSRVKNQGNCGSCWAFSTTGVLESWALFTGRSVSLSEQQLVDCSTAYGNHGCNGGWPSSALNYVKVGGIATEAEYPYAAKNQNCAKNGGSFKLASYGSAKGCPALQTAITARPISVTVDATNWSKYAGGVFNNCATSINHAVLLVGATDSYWKIKNSWASSWGESGYIRLSPGNTCGVCIYDSPYPTA
jgi:cathepsin L